MTYEEEHQRKLLDAYGRQYNDRVDGYARPQSLQIASKFSPETVNAALETARQEHNLNPDIPVWPIIRGAGGDTSFIEMGVQGIGFGPGTVPTLTQAVNPATRVDDGYTDLVNLFCIMPQSGVGTHAIDFENNLSNSADTLHIQWFLDLIDGAAATLIRYTVDFMLAASAGFPYTLTYTPPAPGANSTPTFSGVRGTANVISAGASFLNCSATLAIAIQFGKVKTIQL